jgi:hypothetical protein
MRRLVLVVLVVGCQQRASSPPVEANPAVAHVGSARAAVAIDAAPSSCDVNGRYRLRFRTNGADGWWMRLNVANSQAAVVSDADMLGLLGATPVTTVDLKTCTMTVTATTVKHGEIKLALVVAGDQVAGTLARSDEYEDKISPISGLRETAPARLPACIHPGVYEIAVTHVKTWKTDGRPSIGSCRAFADTHTAHVRLEVLGHEVYIDEVHGEPPYGQTFGRAQVRRNGDCAIVMGIEVQDFRLHEATLELDGDKITGTTSDFTYEVMEDGDAGENMWSCHTRQGDVVWTRLAD